MKLRHRILIIVVSITLLGAALFWLISGVFFTRFLREQEKTQAENIQSNIRTFINEREKKYLGTLNDWGHWDDTYYFLQKTNSEYPKSNLTETVFEDLDIDFMIFFDINKSVFHKEYYDHSRQAFIPFNEDVLHGVLTLATAPNRAQELSGVMEIGDDLYFAALTYVTDSLDQKPPNGQLILGKKIDADMIATLEGLSDFTISSWRSEPPAAQPQIANYAESANVILFDIVIPSESLPSVVFSVEMSRSFFHSGMNQFNRFILLTVISIVIISILLYIILGDYISNPLTSLISEVKSIRLGSRELTRVQSKGKGELAFLSCAVNSMLDQIEAEQNKLKSSEEKLYATLTSVGDGVIAVDRQHRIEFMNPIAERLTGWPLGEAKGERIETVFKIVNEFTREQTQSPAKLVFDSESVVELANHTLLISKDGKERPIEDTAAPIRDKHNKIVGCVLVFRDFSEKKEKQRWIEYLSYHDQLTGLYNRRFFEEELSRLDTIRNLPLSLVFADVNGLKTLNDAFGHHVGDKLIVQVADVLLHECRADDIIARTGGDEFVIILPKTDSASAETLVERIRTAVNSRKIMDITISISFGWDTKTSQDQLIRDILNNAENKMYKKKMFDSSSRRSAVVKSILQTLKIKSSYEEVHSERVSILCEVFGKALNLRTDEIVELKVAGELHDIGKIAIDEAVLSEPELSDVGWAQIKSHPEIGYRLLSNTNEFYNIAEHILAHHERWDGTGYPKGLKEYEISYMARIIAIVDSYDAMKSDRPYRKALDDDQIILEIKKNAGTQFDPQLARVFVEKVLCTNW